MNSVKDLIVFNDHQYTKNSTNSSASSAAAVTGAPSSAGLPPLSIEEVLNDHCLVLPDFSQDPNQAGYSQEACSMQSVCYGNSLDSSNENFLNDDYLNFSFEQPDSLSFGF